MAALPKSKSKRKQPTPKPKHAGGRPRKLPDQKSIDEALEEIKKCAQAGATQQEIASYLKMSVDTLVSIPGFSEVYKRGGDTLNLSLRQAQVRMALSDKPQALGALIWLGKNRLGQKETPVDYAIPPDRLVVGWKKPIPKNELPKSTSSTTPDPVNSDSTTPPQSTKDLSVQ